MKVELHYGKGLMSLQIPEANVWQIIRPWQKEEKVDNLTLLRQATANKEVTNFRDEIAGKRLCVLLDDGTRDEPFNDIFGQLFNHLRRSSLVRFLICTGTHNPQTPENNRIRVEIVKAAKKTGIDNYEIHAHDCEHERYLKAGQTQHGTEIIFNVLADDAEVFLVVSDMKVHYFAGYSNPIKNFVPGICAYETAEQNHRLALDEKSTFGIHPWHSDRSRRNNPLAEDQLEGMQLIIKERPVYALATITTLGKIHWAQFGLIDKVSSEAFTIIDQRNTHTVTPVKRLIVSTGGLPNDTTLYIAQRALELTKSAVTDGGEILFLAACPNGIGEKQTMENFYNRLTAPIDETLKSIESKYKLYNHKPYKFARLIQRLRRIWMYSEIDDNLIEAAHLHPTHEPQTVIDNWLAEEPDVKITVVDGANKIALYERQPSRRESKT
ncbi:MAG: lactate racemase domain-containing protein [Sedimentisphaerales bacterium]